MPRHPSVTITRKAAERALWAIETALDDIDFGIEGTGHGDPDYPRLTRELNAAYAVINRALKKEASRDHA
jgi:hypothetical protein